MQPSAKRPAITQRETGLPVQFEITPDARNSFFGWLELRGGSVEDYVFPSRVDHSRHLSNRQYARFVDEWVAAIGLLSEDYGTHSLRRTKAPIIYKATGNLRAIQILLGHSKLEITGRHLGVDIEDALTLAEKTEAGRQSVFGWRSLLGTGNETLTQTYDSRLQSVSHLVESNFYA